MDNTFINKHANNGCYDEPVEAFDNASGLFIYKWDNKTSKHLNPSPFRAGVKTVCNYES